MSNFLEHTQKLRQHIEAILCSDTIQQAVALDKQKLRRLVDDFYLPMFSWTIEVVDAVQRMQGDAKHCVCIGLSCPQGGGKTTSSFLIQEALSLMGKKCAVISLDDVYWTYDQQMALAKAYPGNPLLQYRGNPGTMDVPLLMSVVHECKTSTNEIAIPRYDKSRHNGRGDRMPKCDWDHRLGPLDVLLIEGWCLGFQAIEETGIELSANMKAVNKELRAFDKLYEELDALIVIKIDNLDWIYDGFIIKEIFASRWREQPEKSLREANKPAMTSGEVRDFVDRFMPAYETYLVGLYADPKESTSPLARIPRLAFSISSGREPVAKPVEFNFKSKTLNN